MTAGRSDRRTVGIRRRGRHSSPSQVEKVALQAGKAAPAVAIAGALVASGAQHALAATDKPAATSAAGHQAHAATADTLTTPATAQATLDSFATRTVTVAAAKPARHAAAATSTYYRVKGGDSLSKIASQHYHNASAWQFLYHENDKTVSDPNLIYVGERLVIPATAPAHYTLSDYVPKHARVTEAAAAVQPAESSTHSRTTHSSTTHSSASHRSTTHRSTTHSGSESAASHDTVTVQAARQGGSYSCSGLEQVWEEAGGSSSKAFMAAEIAMAESGGDPNAISPTDDFGLWQINGSNGALATLNVLANARSAIILSDDGTNWDPWTTYHSGAYSGRC
jgi:LysM repeat protein